MEGLKRQDVYRENKIELTHRFIKVLKRKNFTRRWIRNQKAGQIFAKIVENLFIRRELNRIMEKTYWTALRFKSSYKFRYRRQYGFDMAQRSKNELRRGLTAVSLLLYAGQRTT